MSNIVGKYELGKVLGAGDFDCRIRLCTHTVTGAQYAVKIYDKKVLEESQWMWDQIREAVQVMRTMPKADNIIEMVECFETQRNLYILMQMHAPVQITKIYAESNKRVSWRRTKVLFKQIVAGILHMHQHNVCHLGIAPDHLMVNDKDQLKIGFLVSCKFTQPGKLLHEMRGTQATVAPEVLRQEPYDPYLADTWAVGVILYFMLSGGRYPFDGANTSKNILDYRIRPLNPSISRVGRQLVSALLQPNPQRRMPLEEVIRHSWFTMEEEEAEDSDKESNYSTNTSIVEAHWDNEDDDHFRITIPLGLSREEEAALIIQHTYKLWKHRMAKEESAAAMEHRKPSFKLKKAVSKINLHRTQPSMAHMRAKPRDDGLVRKPPALIDNNPLRCTSCGRLPPPRVIPGKRPYPDNPIEYNKGAFTSTSGEELLINKPLTSDQLSQLGQIPKHAQMTNF